MDLRIKYQYFKGIFIGKLDVMQTTRATNHGLSKRSKNSCQWTRILKSCVFIICIVILILFVIFQTIGGGYRDISFLLLFILVLLPALSAAFWSQCSEKDSRHLLTTTRQAFVIDQYETIAQSSV